MAAFKHMQNLFSKELLKRLINDNPYGRYIEDRDLSTASSVQYVVDCVDQLIDNSKDVEVITHEAHSGITDGLLIVQNSGWDTEHFGKKTAIIKYILAMGNEPDAKLLIINSLLQKFIFLCKDNKIEFVVAKIPSLDLLLINALERIGFSFIESWVFNKLDLRKYAPNHNNSITLRCAEKTDLNFILEFSKNAFVTQRFHADRNIAYEKAESLYSKWIHSAFTDSNQKIIVYDYNGIPSAFLIYYINNLQDYFNLKYAMWKMVLIRSDLRGRGIGACFFNALFAYHKNEGLDIIDSGLSIRNIASLNVHNKTNFKIISVLTTLHLWT